MTLTTVQTIIEFLVFLLVYTLSVSIAGSFRAYVADWMGDDTAKEAGFTSLSPVMHVDPIGLVCLYLFGIGWGRLVPIDYRNIRGTFKLSVAYLSHIVMYIMLGIVSMFIVIAIFGAGPLQSISSLAKLQAVYPQFGSLILVIIRILLAMITINAWLAALGLIRSGFELCMILFFPDMLYSSDTQFIVSFGPLLLMLLFLRPMQIGIGSLITNAAFIIGKLLHLC